MSPPQNRSEPRICFHLFGYSLVLPINIRACHVKRHSVYATACLSERATLTVSCYLLCLSNSLVCASRAYPPRTAVLQPLLFSLFTQGFRLHLTYEINYARGRLSRLDCSVTKNAGKPTYTSKDSPKALDEVFLIPTLSALVPSCLRSHRQGWSKTQIVTGTNYYYCCCYCCVLYRNEEPIAPRQHESNAYQVRTFFVTVQRHWQKTALSCTHGTHGPGVEGGQPLASVFFLR